MPSALSITCGVEADAPLDRWNFLFPFLSFYAGFCHGFFSPATAALAPQPDHTCSICRCDVNRELQLLLERMIKNRKVLQDFENERHNPRSTPVPPPLPSPPPEQPRQRSPTAQAHDMGVQTREDTRLLFYQAQLEDKIEQFKEQELMIGRLQDHIDIVKEQLAEALEAAAAATTSTAGY